MLSCCSPSRQECSWNDSVNLRTQHIPQHLKHYNCKIKWKLFKISEKPSSLLLKKIMSQNRLSNTFTFCQDNKQFSYQQELKQNNIPTFTWKHSLLQPILIHIYTLFTESVLTSSISVCSEHLPTPGVSCLDHQDHHLHSP